MTRATPWPWERLVDTLEELAGLGVTEPHRVAAHLDMKIPTLMRRLYRRGRPDLARPFARVDSANRYARRTK